MRNALLLASSIIIALSFLPYLIKTITKEVKPRVATWLTWSVVTGVGTAAALSAHAYSSAVVTGASTLVTISVLIFALRNGDRDYGWIDGISQAISLIGLVIWQLSNDPAWAIAFAVLADFFGAVPTYYHAWIAPNEEAWHSFMVFSFGCLLSLVAIKHFDFISSAFPIYLTLNSFAISLVIILRQKKFKI